MIDIGANLASNVFLSDIDETLERAANAGLTEIVVTGSDEASCEGAITLCQKTAPVALFATAGIHPHHASEYNTSIEQKLKYYLSQPKVVAVGETGLDFNRNYSPPNAQENAFEQQLALAAQTKKPLFLHERDAYPRFSEILNEYRSAVSDAVVHCFTGSREALFAYLDTDLYIGITGWICDKKRGENLRKLVSNIPLERLMIESDAPYLVPGDKTLKQKLARPGRNEPWTLPFVAEAIAKEYGLETKEIVDITTRNSRRFFRLDEL